jgi:hypothetical protein
MPVSNAGTQSQFGHVIFFILPHHFFISSATCRCMGCQNMPPGGFGPDPRYGYSMPPQTYVAGALQMKNKYPAEEQASAKTGEPLMVDAAQNLVSWNFPLLQCNR